MPIRFNCTCGQEFVVDESRAGQTGACHQCGQQVTVPTLGPTPEGGTGPTLPEGNIDFNCGRCGKHFNVPAHMAGRDGTCTDCGAPIRVPRPGNVPQPIAFHCNRCGKVFRVAAAMAGQWGYCDGCRAPIQVPGGPGPDQPPGSQHASQRMPAGRQEQDASGQAGLGQSTHQPGSASQAALNQSTHQPGQRTDEGYHTSAARPRTEQSGAHRPDSTEQTPSVGVIKFRHACGKGMAVPATLAGKSGTCPQCGRRFVVPQQDGSQGSADTVPTQDDVFNESKPATTETEGPEPGSSSQASSSTGIELPGIGDISGSTSSGWDPLASDPEWDPTASVSDDDWAVPTKIDDTSKPPPTETKPTCQECGKEVPKFSVKCPHCEAVLGRRRSGRKGREVEGPGMKAILLQNLGPGLAILIVMLLGVWWIWRTGTGDVDQGPFGTVDCSGAVSHLLEAWKSEAEAGRLDILAPSAAEDLMDLHGRFLESWKKNGVRSLEIPWKGSGIHYDAVPIAHAWHQGLWKWRTAFTERVRGELAETEAFRRAFGETTIDASLRERLLQMETSDPATLSLLRHVIWTLPPPGATNRPTGPLKEAEFRTRFKEAETALDANLTNKYDDWFEVDLKSLTHHVFTLNEEGFANLKDAFSKFQQHVKDMPTVKVDGKKTYLSPGAYTLTAFGELSGLPFWSEAGLQGEFAFETQEFRYKEGNRSERVVLRVLRLRYGPLVWGPELHTLVIYEYGGRLYISCRE